jgi:hypothetical protein
MVHSTKMQKANDTDVQIANRPVRNAEALRGDPVFQILLGDLRGHLLLNGVEEYPRHLLIVSDGVGVQRRAVFLEGCLFIVDKCRSKVL